MAYFNPNRVDFNYNTNMIDAVGAVGRSLWDIYKQNVQKNQNQMKINETMRSNLASEALTGARNDEIARHNQTIEAETASNNAFTQKFKQNELAEKVKNWNNQALHYANQDKIGMMNANTSLYNADTSRMNANTQAGRLNFDAIKRQEEIDKENNYVNAAFEMLGGAIPQNLAPQDQATYKSAFVKAKTNPQIAKILEAQNGDGLKNLPVGQQNKIQNARAVLDMFVPYVNNLVQNESQVSGILDNVTAPTGKFLGLNSDTVAGLYADADAIAERIRANTKGGGYQAKKDAYASIQPVNTLFSTTMAGNASRIKDQLATLKETADSFKAQGNYRGAQLIETQVDDYIGQFPLQMQKVLRQMLLQDTLQNAPLEQKLKNGRSLGGKPDYYEQADEHGGYYQGSPLDEEW